METVHIYSDGEKHVKEKHPRLCIHKWNVLFESMKGECLWPSPENKSPPAYFFQNKPAGYLVLSATALGRL